jgi:hypothetical protein
MALTTPLPAELVKKLKRAEKAFDDLHDAFEDYLILTNPRFLRKLRPSRRDQLAGKTRPFEELKRELGQLASLDAGSETSSRIRWPGYSCLASNWCLKSSFLTSFPESNSTCRWPMMFPNKSFKTKYMFLPSQEFKPDRTCLFPLSPKLFSTGSGMLKRYPFLYFSSRELG